MKNIRNTEVHMDKKWISHEEAEGKRAGVSEMVTEG